MLVEPAADIRLPLDVSIDAGNIGGPSAGLAFALDVMEKLGRDVDGGRKVAATGELSLDGSVHRIGGIKQKTIGARAADVDVFLVPVENAAEARAHADGLRIVPGAVRRAGGAGPREAARSVVVARNEYAGNSGKSVARPSCILSRSAPSIERCPEAARH